MIRLEEIREFHFAANLNLVTYRSQGYKVKGYLATPKGAGPFPLLLYCRGGLRNIGMTKLAWIAHFVSRGFVVFAPFYRGNRGGEGREDFGGDDRHDVMDALSWLKQLPFIDPARIHLFGFSRGAIPALYTAMKFPEICSVAVWGGVSDLNLTYEERVDLRRMLRRVVGGPPWKNGKAYARRSPVFDIKTLECPVLIIHGKQDQLVGVAHAHRLAEALRQAGKRYQLWIDEQQGHLFNVAQQAVEMDRMLTWMQMQE
ncbi:hypothetical protein BEP19_08570 [Ammoniphilus oxalaticus]|uniref:Peptidase S9 prolyl oligopeptidase catalytic domain-containing protein n=1 Tax=Ammoniphilus oxalaticus TaxID=66863 RepID=A0A419SKC3_9BACL|nr:prolyl oligopeptidase family serine peptidase [Ammoniphilus oxalaticus]RKD24432.1 hypothetical protein BEP19_08570 [Ammoniphilus oxalaticus]